VPKKKARTDVVKSNGKFNDNDDYEKLDDLRDQGMSRPHIITRSIKRKSDDNDSG
jgi:hypothetical protein